MQKAFPRLILMTIYKAFARPDLDYGDIIYDKAYKETFHRKRESIHYNVCRALFGAIRGSLRGQEENVTTN